MADLTLRTGTLPSKASNLIAAENQIDGIAGVKLKAGELVYIEENTGLVLKAVADGGGEAPEDDAVGVTAGPCNIGEPVTVYRRAHFALTNETGSGSVVKGKNYYVSDTPGAFSDTPIYNGAKSVAKGHPTAEGVIMVDC